MERTEAVEQVAIPTCGTCRAFLRDGDLGDLEPPYGECRRRCPQVLAEEPGVHDAVWPTVSANRAGCWDHLPIEAPR